VLNNELHLTTSAYSMYDVCNALGALHINSLGPLVHSAQHVF